MFIIIVTLLKEELKAKGVPVKQRKYLLRTVNYLRRGILTFEYLSRRTVVKPCRKITIAKQAPAKANKQTKA